MVFIIWCSLMNEFLYVPKNCRDFIRLLNTPERKHPVKTYQLYDFRMNLDVFGTNDCPVGW